MTRISQMAAVLSYATLAVMAASVLTALALLLRPDLAQAILLQTVPAVRAATPPGLGTLYALQAAGWVVLGLQLFVLWQIYRLFGLYAAGRALSEASSLRLRRIGLGLMLFPVAASFYGAVASVLLSWGNGPGARELALNINVQSLGFVVGGALLLFVGSSIREAMRLEAENRSFV